MATFRVLLLAALASVRHSLALTRTAMVAQEAKAQQAEAILAQGTQAQRAETVLAQEAQAQRAEAVLAHEAKAQRAETEAQVARPNGPLLMNLTKMDIAALPRGSRHVDSLTVTADWINEYPQYLQQAAVTPAPVSVPAAGPPPATEAPPAVKSSAVLAAPALAVLMVMAAAGHL
mmetsp:Transcript_94193/g.275496  ORF Transcript_94193/g.275496 Transcript_94193/m.275496 type:complete len:175 (-) Transcript_94193:54-578(-)